MSNIAGIATDPDLVPKLVVVVSNCANSTRDDDVQKGGIPLSWRAKKYAQRLAEIEKSCPEPEPYSDPYASPSVPRPIGILVVLEAGRSTQGHRWSKIQRIIEEETGLVSYGCFNVNNTGGGMAKHVFYNPARVFIQSVIQEWVPCGKNIGGPGYGQSSIRITAQPVISGKVLIDHTAIVYATHLSMNEDSRMAAVEYFARLPKKYANLTVIGDMNTFPDSCGPEMQSRMISAGFRECLPADTKWTFSAFAADTLSVPTETIPKFHPHSGIVREISDSMTLVRPRTWLDHSFSTDPDVIAYTHDTTSKGESDHDAVVTIIPYRPGPMKWKHSHL